MIWEKLDWAALDRLRETFLSADKTGGPYWTSDADLAAYDATFGERIGWKWDFVLRELRLRGWRPRARSVLDWGCGSGIAGRRVVDFFGVENFAELLVWDHSPRAVAFAHAAARRAFPALSAAPAAPDFRSSSAPVGLLVLSHVLNELSAETRAALLALCRRAEEILWVEPGTREVSRGLIAFREELAADFNVIAPCTHQRRCGLLAPENARHWCHSFAAPPPGIFTNSDWVRFGRRAGIDLRSLPCSFLVLRRKSPADAPPDETAARLLGAPRVYKGFAKLLACAAGGVAELTLQKRDAPALFKALKQDEAPAPPVYHWTRTGTRITSLAPPPSAAGPDHASVPRPDAPP